MTTDVFRLETEALATIDAKGRIYEKVQQWVKDKTGKNIGMSGGHAIFNLVVAEIFKEAVEEGHFRFNGGYGSLHVRSYGAGTRKLPSGGPTVTFGERKKLRYEEGIAVALLHNAVDGTTEPAVS